MNSRFNSINFKVVFVTTLIVLIFGILATVNTYLMVSNQIFNQKEDDFKAVLEKSSSLIEQVFSQPNNLLNKIASDDLLKSVVDSKSLSKKDITDTNSYLSKFNTTGEYFSIFITDINGKILSSSDGLRVNQDIGTLKYFQKAIQGINFNQVIFDEINNKLGYYISAPIRDQKNQIIGSAVVILDSSIVNQAFSRLLSTKVNDLMLVDDMGVVVESKRPERILHSLGQFDLEDEKILAQYSNKYGVEVYPLKFQEVLNRLKSKPLSVITIPITSQTNSQDEFLLTPVKNNNLYLICEVNNSEISVIATKISLFTSLAVGGTTFITIILLVLFLSDILKPIQMLTRMANKIAGGNFELINPITSKDEFYILGEVLMNMSISIKNKFLELETMVAERTQKLESQTNILSQTQLAIQNLLEDTNLAREEAEKASNDLEKFKKAVDNSSDHMVITNREGVIIYANLAVTKLTGYTIKEILGKKAGDKSIWGGEMSPEFYQKMWQTIKIDKKPFSGQINNHRKNGQKYIAEAHIYPILDAKNEVIFFVGIERDATVEREVDRMKTEFVSFASHQLRTPLSAMKWFSEILLSGDAGKLTSKQAGIVKDIYDSNERMLKLIKNLLDISRIESGRIIIDPVPTDMNKLVENIVAEVRSQYSDATQQIITKISPQLPTVNLDPELIRNVFTNLLTNAYKYTPPKGKITITIVKKGQEILSQVTDTGYGIPLEDQPQIFDKFFRASNIHKKQTEGTGLGLYIVKSIVESSGGKIGLESVENKGSTFWFTLPIIGAPSKKGEIKLGS